MDAKVCINATQRRCKVSIHAPVMDANIEAREAELVTKVSIHAPVMDANKMGAILYTYQGFNPRARDGREYI